MNRRQFIILFALVVVLGGAALVHYRRQAASWSNSGPQLGQKLMGEFQVNDVAQIKITDGTNALTLEKAGDLWRVRERGNYPADFSRISGLLLKLRDLKIVQTVPALPSQWPQLGLAAPGQGNNSATLLEFSASDGKPIRTLWLGKNHLQHSRPASPDGDGGDWPDGRYVLTGTNSPTVAVVSDALGEAVPQPGEWLDKTFFKVETPRSISVSFPAATNSWELARDSETNGWKLADAKPDEKLDDTKVSETAGAFSSPSFSDVAVDMKPAQTGLDLPVRVKIKTFDGFNYDMEVGRETNDDYYFSLDNVSATFPVEPASGTNEAPQDKAFQDNLKKMQDRLARDGAFTNRVYLIPSWSLQPLLKIRAELLLVATNTPSASDTNAPPP